MSRTLQLEAELLRTAVLNLELCFSDLHCTWTSSVPSPSSGKETMAEIISRGKKSLEIFVFKLAHTKVDFSVASCSQRNFCLQWLQGKPYSGLCSALSVSQLFMVMSFDAESKSNSGELINTNQYIDHYSQSLSRSPRESQEFNRLVRFDSSFCGW